MKGKQWILAAMAAAALVMPLSSYAAAAPQASPAAVTQKAQVPAPAYADSTLQATRYGLLQGAQEGDDFVWRGVPYGQAERWKTPENPSSWTGVRDALKTGPMGTQETAKGVKGVESCLNLDIFRPATKEQNLPVLYFIHGGNNQNGAADQVNLSQFAKRANVVAVSINYRLGALGYNPLPAVQGKHRKLRRQSGQYHCLGLLLWRPRCDGAPHFTGSKGEIPESHFLQRRHDDLRPVLGHRHLCQSLRSARRR